jgi:DNA-directed RNA polymerase specialized sigma24 family protein
METKPEPIRGWHLNTAAFEAFLTWLDEDRERAGEKYELLRAKLIRVFLHRGCSGAEDLADQTLDRVARKLYEGAEISHGDPTSYIYAVAGYVYKEHARKRIYPPPDLESDQGDLELAYDCLEQCLLRLSPTSRELILQYYKDDRQARIKGRQQLANQLGIGYGNLRIRALRIRSALSRCVRDCMMKKDLL